MNLGRPEFAQAQGIRRALACGQVLQSSNAGIRRKEEGLDSITVALGKLSLHHLLLQCNQKLGRQHNLNVRKCDTYWGTSGAI